MEKLKLVLGLINGDNQWLNKGCHVGDFRAQRHPRPSQNDEVLLLKL